MYWNAHVHDKRDPGKDSGIGHGTDHQGQTTRQAGDDGEGRGATECLAGCGVREPQGVEHNPNDGRYRQDEKDNPADKATHFYQKVHQNLPDIMFNRSILTKFIAPRRLRIKKSEILSSKSQTNQIMQSKILNPKRNYLEFMFFDHLDLFRISDFEFVNLFILGVLGSAQG